MAGDCAYTVTGEVTIRAEPKSSAGKLFFIGYLIETANAGKATGVLKAETTVTGIAYAVADSDDGSWRHLCLDDGACV